MMSRKQTVNCARAMNHKTWIKPRHDVKAMKKGHNAVSETPTKLAKMTVREELFYKKVCGAFSHLQ
jgi:hypothetical protein